MLGCRYILTVCLISVASAEFEPAYFKVCSSEFRQVVDSNQCDKGIWLKSSIEPGCVCVRGVWALSGGFCDSAPMIIVGDGHCYHVNYPIRSAKLIGDPKDPFKPKVYLVPMSLDAVVEVTEGTFTDPLATDNSMIIGINPRLVAQRKDWGLCIDLNPEDYGKPVHVFVNPRRMMTVWTLNKKKTYACSTTTSYQYHVGFGERFSVANTKIQPRKLVERNCKLDCPGEVAPVAGKQPGKGTDLISNVDVSSRVEPMQKARKKSLQERVEEMEEMRAKATWTADYYEKEVNEQTLRMMHAHISPLLLNINGPQVVTREYQYFQHIRVVVEKACPEEYVPKQILRGLMRMFRQLLWETQDTFQHMQGGDDAQFNRTLTRLSECGERTTKPAVLFSTYNESYNPKDNMTAPEPERCPIPIVYAINGTGYNRTHQYPEEGQFIRNYTYWFPSHLKYNGSQVDFVIEAAWKITMIGHYRCSKYFDDETAIDFSHFFHQIQSFFNHHIIKRWYFHKSVNATYDIVKMIFPSYDLKKFMFGLDSCLAGTQGFSHFDYSNIWIQRPKIPHTENDLSQKSYMHATPNSHLDTRDYAPDPTTPPPPGKEKEKKKEKETKEKRRGKRDLGKFPLWGGWAKCLGGYMDPITNIEYGYFLPSDCVIPFDPKVLENGAIYRR